MRGRYTALLLLGTGVGFAGGYALDTWHDAQMGAADTGPEILYWVAPMDPNFRKDGPGKSPMGMDLIPVLAGQETSGAPGEVMLSPAEVNAIGVRSAVARIEDVAATVETVGFVGFDEHATSHIHMRVEGWIERLELRANGDKVAKGDLLYELYAPEITIASLELQSALRRNDKAEIRIARKKLGNFGVSDAQIETMGKAESPSQIVKVYAPQDGVVVDLNAADGMYLTPGTRAMSLSDLSSVWLLIDVFERDIGRLTADMRAVARFDHLPGRSFEGQLDYIFPDLDPVTRTLRVRLRLANPDLLLRPNMFASVSLIPAAARQALTIPSEAVIRTGRGERVILRHSDGSFRPRLVTTALRGGFGDGTRTEILQGLEPGEEVVASAQFLIDSESALNAGMMRFAPTANDPAGGKGKLIALDPATRQVTIDHDAIDAMGWPAMQTRFTYGAEIATDRLQPGDTVRFAVAQGVDGLLWLSDLRADDGIEATGTGTVHAVTEDGELSLSHDPIPALGWPAMQMDMPVRGLDTATVPIDMPISFDLAKDEDGMFVIVALRAGEDIQTAETSAAMVEAEVEAEAEAITTIGTINSVDAEARMANITHGPIEAIGMPGMTMEFPLAEGLAPDALPLDKQVELRMTQGNGMMLTVTGIREVAQ